MEMTLNRTKEVKLNQKGLLFNVPTPITNLQPIFTFIFNLTHDPSVTITLNPDLRSEKGKKSEPSTFTFNENGLCNFDYKETDDYFINGEILLDKVGSSIVPKCKMLIDYGKGENELFFLKGTFNLNEFNE